MTPAALQLIKIILTRRNWCAPSVSSRHWIAIKFVTATLAKWRARERGSFPWAPLCAALLCRQRERMRLRFIDFANLECERAGERCQSALMFRNNRAVVDLAHVYLAAVCWKRPAAALRRLPWGFLYKHKLARLGLAELKSCFIVDRVRYTFGACAKRNTTLYSFSQRHFEILPLVCKSRLTLKGFIGSHYLLQKLFRDQFGSIWILAALYAHQIRRVCIMLLSQNKEQANPFKWDNQIRLEQVSKILPFGGLKRGSRR